MSGCIQARARLQVKAIPGREEVIGLAMLIDRHFAGPDYFKLVALDDDGGTLVDTDPKQLGMGRDHGEHIVLALALQQMLVDGYAAQESETLLVAGGHHDAVTRARPAHQRGA